MQSRSATCPSTVNLLKQMAGEASTEKSLLTRAGESVVNPDDWPHVDLKPSKGSVKRTTLRGPWR